MNITDTLLTLPLSMAFYILLISIYSIVKHYQENKEGIASNISKEFQVMIGNLVRRLRKHL
jgi:hypothetical protein